MQDGSKSRLSCTLDTLPIETQHSRVAYPFQNGMKISDDIKPLVVFVYEMMIFFALEK